MFTKTLNTLIICIAVVALGFTAVAFTSTDAKEKNNVERMDAAPQAGVIVAGTVRQGDGRTLNPGTGDWTSGRISTGRYWVDATPYSSQAPIAIVSPVDDKGGQSADNIITTYNHDHARGKVYFACIDKNTGELQDSNFSFIMYVK